jgi:hypothetical protein
MRAFLGGSLALALALAVSGCAYGLIYTHTVAPLMLNQHATQAASTEAIGDIKHIQVGWLGVMWGQDGLGEIAREHGITELRYADLEYLSVLTVWQQYTVHLYGK